MDKIKELEGSVSTEDFILGLLQVSKNNTLGEIWEKCISCPQCVFAPKCEKLCDAADDLGSPINRCSEVIRILLGETKFEDVIGG